ERLREAGQQCVENGLAISPDGRLLATGGGDGVIQLWDLATGQAMPKLTGHRSEITSLEFSRDGRVLASGSMDGGVKLWDTDTWKPRVPFEQNEGVRCVALSPAGRTLALGSTDQAIRLWDTADGKELHALAGHLDLVNQVAWAPDGRSLVSGSVDGTVKV